MSGYFTKYATYLGIEHLIRSRFLQVGLSLNLKFSLLEEQGEEVVDIKAMQEKMIDRIEDTNYSNLSAEEFFYE